LEFGLLSSVSLGLLKNSNGLPKKSVLVLDLSLLVSASPEGVGEVSSSFSLFSTPVRSHGRKKLSPALSKSSRLRRLLFVFAPKFEAYPIVADAREVTQNIVEKDTILLFLDGRIRLRDLR